MLPFVCCIIGDERTKGVRHKPENQTYYLGDYLRTIARRGHIQGTSMEDTEAARQWHVKLMNNDLCNEQQVEALKAKGNAALTKGNTGLAVEIYTHAIQLAGDGLGRYSPLAPALYCNRSKALAALGRWEESAMDARACIGLDMQYTKGYFRLAQAYLELGRPDAAMEWLAKGMNLCPSEQHLLLPLLQTARMPASPTRLQWAIQAYHQSNCHHSDAVDALLRLEDNYERSRASVMASKVQQLQPGDIGYLAMLAIDQKHLSSHGAEIPSRACALLRHLELKGIAHFLTTSWPSRPDEYWQCDCDEDATDFIKLILSDGADAFLPLMMVVRNFIPMLKIGVKTFWAENSSLVNNDQEVLLQVLHRTLEVHFSFQAQAVACLEHLCKQGVLTEEQKRLFSAVCRQQICAVRDTGEPHSAAFLRFAKREVHTFTRSLQSALVCLRDTSAVPALRNAAIRDMLDLDRYGPWGDILKEFGAYPNTEVDKALHLRSSEVRKGRLEWRYLRLRLQLGEMHIGMVPDTDNVDGLPKCTNWACDVLATHERPFKVTCGVCNAGFCSQACKAEEERWGHANVCKAGRYPNPKQDGGETSNQDESPGGSVLVECAACHLQESYQRQFSKCSGCRAVKYCSNACLRFHWSFGGHRLSCTDSSTLLSK